MVTDLSTEAPKKANILVNSNFDACLTDFGVTTILHHTASQSMSSSTHGTLRWMAPELLRFDDADPESGLPTTSSDMYAFGLVCWEVSPYDLQA